MPYLRHLFAEVAMDVIRRAVHQILTTQQPAAKQRFQNLRHINKNFTVTCFKCQK